MARRAEVAAETVPDQVRQVVRLDLAAGADLRRSCRVRGTARIGMASRRSVACCSTATNSCLWTSHDAHPVNRRSRRGGSSCLTAEAGSARWRRCIGSAVRRGAMSPRRRNLTAGCITRRRVRRVIQLFMNGGASPMDTFDYKPELARLHGQMLGPKEKPEGFTAAAGAVMKSPFEFAQHGHCGRWVSSVFPHQAKIVDDMAFLMAMSSKTNVHGPASYMMNTGFVLPGFPCMGAWISYALGSLIGQSAGLSSCCPMRAGLPVQPEGQLQRRLPPGEASRHVGQRSQSTAGARSVRRSAVSVRDRHGRSARTVALLQQVNHRHAEAHPGDTRLEARLAAGELAAKMQLSAPEAFDLSRESAATHAAYGLDQPPTEDFGRRCLLARRLIERGMRFVQVWSGPQGAISNWDNHGNIQTELPADRRQRGSTDRRLLQRSESPRPPEDTLVIWTTEFGRTPFAQGSQGRDHNGGTFVTWLAGAGVKAGVDLRTQRRPRLSDGRRSDVLLRPARHDPASAGHRPRTSDLPHSRHRPPTDGRPRARRAGDSGVAQVRRQARMTTSVPASPLPATAPVAPPAAPSPGPPAPLTRRPAASSRG